MVRRTDELDRVENALHAIDNVDEPVEAAAVLAYRVARAQGFGEANSARPSFSRVSYSMIATVSTVPPSCPLTIVL